MAQALVRGQLAKVSGGLAQVAQSWSLTLRFLSPTFEPQS